MTLDGAVNNDVFGLSGSGTNGGQTGATPISPDAIGSMEVVVSPYDVTLGNFTGGGVNIVTRSGTNEFEGSAYYFTRNENISGKTPTDDEEVERTKLNNFSSNTYGFRVGGPLIKNKLFFFANGEIQRDQQSQPFAFDSYRGDLSQGEIEGLRDFVQSEYGYPLGAFLDNPRELDAQKFLVKLDWNINEKHKLSLRNNFAFAEELEGDQSGPTSINFLNGAELFPSTTNTTTLEWAANFSDNVSNKLILGYTSVRDDRGFSGSPFPRVQIQDGRNSVNFGSEPFSIGNELNQDVFIFTNNLTFFKGKHSITVGTHNEIFSIYNLFLRENYGVYRYGSLDNFYNGIPNRYVRSYALLPSVDAAQGDDATSIAAEFGAAQFGFYVQDEFQVNDKLRLSGGLRIDIPVMFDKPEANQNFNDNYLPGMLDEWESLYDERPEVSSGEIPSGNILFSPRVGFNYDAKEDNSLIIRGGLGLFTGRVPFVWPGGSYTNNGVFIASIFQNNPEIISGGDTLALPFSSDPNNQYTGGDLVGGREGASQIDLFADDFRFPQVFRASIAADVKLPLGLIGTGEVLYTNNINQIFYRNINVEAPQNRIQTSYGDDRPVYQGAITSDFDRVLLATNTNQGHSYNLTAQVQKPFSSNNKKMFDWSANVAYTFGRSRVLSDGTSSQNSSNWRNVEVVDRNDLEMGFSDFDLGSRVTAFLSGKVNYGDFGASTLSLFFNGQSGRRFSYTYTQWFGAPRGGIDAINGDDRAGRDFNNLIHIPADRSEINLIDVVDGDGNVTLSADEQWNNLNTFIENDSYLSNNRGNIAERNAGRLPFETILDLKFVQDFYIMAGDKRNQLQFTFDIFNFTNFLNKDWGRRREMNFDNLSMINFEGFVDTDNNNYTPQFTYRENADFAPKDEAQIVDEGFYSSRWQMQFGVRYIFN